MSDNDYVSFTLPEGRLINSAFFEKDVYKSKDGKEGTPMYKAEVAFDPDVLLDMLTNPAFDYVVSQLGASAEDDFELDPREPARHIKTPLKNGDEMARDRERNGKEGDAYKGKLVLRTNTLFNLDGNNAPGGIAVYGPDLSRITVTDQGQVYNGCYGHLGVSPKMYTTNEGKPALKFYLVAFQKTRDGEKLVSQQDRSSLFKPVGRTEGEAPARRRRG